MGKPVSGNYPTVPGGTRSIERYQRPPGFIFTSHSFGSSSKAATLQVSDLSSPLSLSADCGLGKTTTELVFDRLPEIEKTFGGRAVELEVNLNDIDSIVAALVIRKHSCDLVRNKKEVLIRLAQPLFSLLRSPHMAEAKLALAIKKATHTGPSFETRSDQREVLKSIFSLIERFLGNPEVIECEEKKALWEREVAEIREARELILQEEEQVSPNGLFSVIFTNKQINLLGAFSSNIDGRPVVMVVEKENGYIKRISINPEYAEVLDIKKFKGARICKKPENEPTYSSMFQLKGRLMEKIYLFTVDGLVSKYELSFNIDVTNLIRDKEVLLCANYN